MAEKEKIGQIRNIELVKEDVKLREIKKNFPGYNHYSYDFMKPTTENVEGTYGNCRRRSSSNPIELDFSLLKQDKHTYESNHRPRFLLLQNQ